MEENMTNNVVPPKPASKTLWVVAGVVVVVLAGFVLARSMSSKPSGETKVMTKVSDVGLTETVQKVELPGGSMSQGEIRTIAVEGGAFYYKPNEIRVKKGEKVKVVLSSKDMVHDFVIDELGVRTAVIKAGDTGTVEFTADKAGTFEYYCSIGQHRKNGMVGKLIVE